MRKSTALAAAAIALAALAAYADSFSGPFVLDDIGSIVENPTIRHLGRLSGVLHPPFAGGETVGGRPVVNLTLAVNYAISGLNVWSYHAVNLLIHILAGLALYGMVWRFFVARGVPAEPRRAGTARPTLIALAVALLWTVHPLQTESVTYVIQRAESLMGLFYLLTLYCFARYAEGENLAVSATGRSGMRKHFAGIVWAGLSVLSCLLGMCTKEVMVSAPVIVFLADRTFVSGSFAEAWRRRRGYYGVLAATWLPLAWLVAETGGDRGGSAGMASHVTWSAYVLTQFPALIHYLRLAVWPHPLVFYHPVRWTTPTAAAPFAIAIIGLAGGALYALIRGRPIGFLGAWFFAILAPTSLIPGSGQTLAEHRMYLALVPPIAAAVIGLFRFRRGTAAWVAIALVLLFLTGWRNRVYRSELALWRDTAAHSPGNPLAECNVGVAYAHLGNIDAARTQFEKALAIQPNFTNALLDLGNLQRLTGKPAEAAANYERALLAKPDFAEAEANLAFALCDLGRTSEATGHYRRALELKPGNAEWECDLANALCALGRSDEARTAYSEAIGLRPELAEAHNGLGLCLAALGRMEEAVVQYRQAISLKRNYPEAAYNLGNLLAQHGRLDEAGEAYAEALRMKPDFVEAHYNYGLSLRAAGRMAEAEAQFQEASGLRRTPP